VAFAFVQFSTNVKATDLDSPGTTYCSAVAPVTPVVLVVVLVVVMLVVVMLVPATRATTTATPVVPHREDLCDSHVRSP
jgi:di/tricarboxylate transporter